MCEITNGKIYVADRDLVCYKLMFDKEGLLKSVYQQYEYEIGREYCIRAFEYRCCQNDNIIVYEAWSKTLHSLYGLIWKKVYTIRPHLYNNIIARDLCFTRCGFYSYTYYGNDSMERGIKNIFSIHGFEKLKCVRCRIPEGSKYMVSDDGEVFISERIVIDDAWLMI